MTVDEAMTVAARELDAFIARQLQEHEARLRADSALTGPEDQTALDEPPDPESPWRRATVEECMAATAHKLAVWRSQVLAEIRADLETSVRTTGKPVSALHRA
jgi:hypothetical protein